MSRRWVLENGQNLDSCDIESINGTVLWVPGNCQLCKPIISYRKDLKIFKVSRFSRFPVQISKTSKFSRFIDFQGFLIVEVSEFQNQIVDIFKICTIFKIPRFSNFLKFKFRFWSLCGPNFQNFNIFGFTRLLDCQIFKSSNFQDFKAFSIFKTFEVLKFKDSKILKFLKSWKFEDLENLGNIENLNLKFWRFEASTVLISLWHYYIVWSIHE